jgi:hypothetical protein
MPAEDLQLYVWLMALPPYRKSQLRQKPNPDPRRSPRVLTVILPVT